MFTMIDKIKKFKRFVKRNLPLNKRSIDNYQGSGYFDSHLNKNLIKISKFWTTWKGTYKSEYPLMKTIQMR